MNQFIYQDQPSEPPKTEYVSLTISASATIVAPDLITHRDDDSNGHTCVESV